MRARCDLSLPCLVVQQCCSDDVWLCACTTRKHHVFVPVELAFRLRISSGRQIVSRMASLVQNVGIVSASKLYWWCFRLFSRCCAGVVSWAEMFRVGQPQALV